MKKCIATLMISLISFSVLSSPVGTFDLKVKINQTMFDDILIIDQESPEGILTGRFIVPRVFDVSFTGVNNSKQIRGHFFAEESGSRFKVDLKATLIGSCYLTGQLLQKGKVFGRFQGEKRGCDE